MDIQTLSTIINAASIAILVIFGIVLILSIILGAKKKLIRSTYGLIFMGSLVLISFFILEPVSNFAMGFDLKPMLGQSFVITFNNQSMTVVVGTLKETIQNFYIAFCELNKIAITTKVLSSISELTVLTIKYLTFMAQLVLILILGSLFCWLLWILVFQRFIPYLVTKFKKFRWLAAIENAVKVTVVFGLFIASGTSLVNTIDQTWKKMNLNVQGNETLKLIDDALTVYDNSVLGKLFSFTVDKEGVTLDTKIINSFVTNSFNGYSTSLFDFIYELGDIAGTISNAFTFGNQITVDFSYLASSQTLLSFFNALNKSNILYSLLPMALEVAMNSKFIEDYMASDIFDLSNINWDEETLVIENVVLDLASSGVFDEICPDGDINHIKVVPKDLTVYCLDDEHFGTCNSALKRIGESDALSQILKALLIYQVEHNEDVKKYINLSREQICNLDISEEFSIVLSSIYEINKVEPQFVTSLFDSIDTPKNDVEQLENEDGKANIIDLIVEHYDAFSDILIGSFDRKGHPINVDEEGYSKSENKCLLDSHLINALLPGVKDTFMDLLKQSLEGKLDLDIDAMKVAYEQLCSGHIALNMKEEFNILLYVLKTVLLYKDIFTNFSLESINNLSDPDISLIANTVTMLDDSKLLNSVIPSLTDLIITNSDVADVLEKYGLSIDDFDLRPTDSQGKSILCDELAYIISNVRSVTAMATLVDGEISFSEIHDHYLDVATLLDVFFNSEILNPSKKFYDGDVDNSFFKILKTVFGDGVNKGLINIDGIYFNPTPDDLYPYAHKSGDHKWNNTRDEYGNFYLNKYGEPILNGENGYVANVIFEATKKVIVDGEPTDLPTLVSKGFDFGANLKVLESSNEKEFRISKFLENVDSSMLFSNNMGRFLDSNFSQLVDLKNNISFENVNDWTREGLLIKDLIHSIDVLGINLSNLDFSKVTDFAELNVLLHNLSDSKIFESRNGDYLFNLFFYSKISSVLGSDANKYLSNPDSIPSSKNTIAMDDFDFYEDDEEKWHSFAVQEDWQSSSFNPNDRTSEEFFDLDQIARVCKFLKTANDEKNISEAKLHKTYADIFSYLKSGDATASQLSHVLLEFNDADCLRMPLYHVLKDTFDSLSYSISGQSISLKDANVECLANDTLNKEERHYELSLLGDALISLDRIRTSGSIDIQSFLDHKENVVNLNYVVHDMNESMIFHRAGPNIGKENTLFQTCVKTVLATDDFKNLLFNNKSPKDSYHFSNGDYTKDTKGSYLTDTLFAYNTIDFDSQEIELDNFTEALSTIVGGYVDISDIKLNYDDENHFISAERISDPLTPITNHNGLKDSSGKVTTNFQNVDLTKINSSDIYDMLNSLNNSNLLSDCVGNGLNSIFSNIGSSSVKGLDFSNANFYYYYLNSDGTFNVNYENNKMGDDEIYIISSFVDFSNELSNFDISKITSLTQEQFTLKMLALENLGDAMYSSLSMHLFDVVRYNQYLTDDKLTTYESFMKNIYMKTGLASKSYDETLDGPIYGDLSTKINTKIKLLSKYDYDGIDNPYGFNSSWEEENAALFTLLNDSFPILKSLGAEKTFDDLNIDITNPIFAPEILEALFDDINHVFVIDDALPNMIKQSFNTIGFNAFSSYENIDYASYYLTPFEYDYAQGKEIQNISYLLETFSIKDDQGKHLKYFDMSDPTNFSYEKFKEAGIDINNFLEFGRKSLMYDNEFKTDLTVHDLFFYNFFNKIKLDDFIFGSTSIEKIKTLHADLALVTDFNKEYESLNYLYELSTYLGSGFDPSDFTSLNEIKTPLYLLMASTTYNIDSENNDYLGDSHARSYLTSEISSGIMESITNQQIEEIKSKYDYRSYDNNFGYYRLDNENNHITSPSDLCSESYDKLSIKEIKSLYAGISLTRFDVADPTSIPLSTLDFRALGFKDIFNIFDANDSNTQIGQALYANNMYEKVIEIRNQQISISGSSLIPGDSLNDIRTYIAPFSSYGESLAIGLGIN